MYVKAVHLRLMVSAVLVLHLCPTVTHVPIRLYALGASLGTFSWRILKVASIVKNKSMGVKHVLLPSNALDVSQVSLSSMEVVDAIWTDIHLTKTGGHVEHIPLKDSRVALGSKSGHSNTFITNLLSILDSELKTYTF